MSDIVERLKAIAALARPSPDHAVATTIYIAIAEIERLRSLQAPAESELEAAHRQGYVRGLVDEADRHAWRPIESAPKDGTAVLLFGDGDTFVGQWSTYSTWNLVHAGGYAEDADAPSSPTLWLPLPEPPKG
jgi:hypothetical protein